MADLDQLITDLAAEHRALDKIVSSLDEPMWDLPTPAQGWTVRDQVGHLAFFDAAASESVRDRETFARAAARALDGSHSPLDDHLERGRSMPGGAVREWWRLERAGLLDALSGIDPSARLAWYGPDMGASSFVTARLMETWAHGHDVCDALGREAPATERLRHVAFLGVATRRFSYASRGLAPPEDPVRVELSAPDRGEWILGEETSSQLVRGPALDFCLVVTQRRHLDDTEIVTEGEEARSWLLMAQAFAGPPTEGPPPRRISAP